MNIYPVFHKSLLEKAPQDATPGPVAIHEETQEPMYDVERILDYTFEGYRPLYLVKWTGYPDSENTWEPARNLTKDVVKRYNKAWQMFRPNHQKGSTPLPKEWWDKARQARRPMTENGLCDTIGFHETTRGSLYAMYEQPPGYGKMKRVVAVGHNPERYLIQWEPIQDNTWELAKDVPTILIRRFYRTINQIAGGRTARR
jgi:hypothetical protein